MEALAALIRWIIEYAVSGGFWHFIAVLMIVRAVASIAALVRVRVNIEHKTKKEDD